MENLVERIIELQKKANDQIDNYSEISDDLAYELEQAYDLLTPEQEDELIRRSNEIHGWLIN